MDVYDRQGLLRARQPPEIAIGRYAFNVHTSLENEGEGKHRLSV